MVSIGRLWLFFFFQAEDGIRDVAVTGVQTCALPISPRPTRPAGIRRSCGCASESRARRRARAHGQCQRWCAPGRRRAPARPPRTRSEEHTSELQSRLHLVCRLLLEKKKKTKKNRKQR